MGIKWSVMELGRTTPWCGTIVVTDCCCQEKWICEEFRSVICDKR